MQASGNDYVYFDARKDALAPFADLIGKPRFAEFAAWASDRHFGVGGDGAVVLLPPVSRGNDARMRIFNADGSEGKICGNALRCVGVYLLLSEETCAVSRDCVIETESGAKAVSASRSPSSGSEKGYARVNMGIPLSREISREAAVYVLRLFDTYRRNSPDAFGFASLLSLGAVSVGNEHLILYLDGKPSLALSGKVGAALNASEYFPDGVNVDFLYNCGDGVFSLTTFERGSGLTMSCGSGSCAAAFFARERVLVDVYADADADANTRAPVKLLQRGGESAVSVTESGEYVLSGGAEVVFRGSVSYDFS